MPATSDIPDIRTTPTGYVWVTEREIHALHLPFCAVHVQSRPTCADRVAPGEEHIVRGED